MDWTVLPESSGFTFNSSYSLPNSHQPSLTPYSNYCCPGPTLVIQWSHVIDTHPCNIPFPGTQERSIVLDRLRSPQTHHQPYPCEQPLEVYSNYSSSSHNYNVRSQGIQPSSQSNLPFKKRKDLFREIFPAEGIIRNEAINSHSESLPESAIFTHCLRSTVPAVDSVAPSSICNPVWHSYNSYPEDLPLSLWSRSDVCKRISHVLIKKGVSPLETSDVLQKLDGLDGKQLSELSLEDWCSVSETWGPMLLHDLHPPLLPKTIHEEQAKYGVNKNLPTEKKKRTRKRGGQCVGQLWEFMFKMLDDPATNPSVICWEDKDKRLFRIVDTEKLAHLWGRRKGKPNLTYANMSRTMRYYKKGEGAFIPDDRKRVYGFGPKANIEKLKKSKASRESDKPASTEEGVNS